MELAPPYSDRGEDTDGDGLFDFLVIEVPLVVHEDREYFLNVYLQVGPYQYFVASNVSFLAVGKDTLAVRFYGPSIYAARADGPYEVVITLTWFVGFSNWTLIDRYTTSPYRYVQFDPMRSVGASGRSEPEVIAIARKDE